MQPVSLKGLGARRGIGLVTLACALGCGEGAGFEGETIAISTGTFEVPAGTELTYCVYVDLPAEGDFPVVGYRAEMLPGSHHFNMFFTDPTHPIVRDKPRGVPTSCDTGYKFYLAGSQWTSIDQVIPDGLAITIPARSLLVLESHYVNATDQPFPGRVDVELDRGDPDALTAELGLHFNVMDAIRIEPGERVRLRGVCPAAPNTQVALLTSHMHGFGEAFEINLVDDDTGETTPLYLSENYAHPETVELWREPIAVGPRQSLEWACTYHNPGDTPVVGGGSAERDEMCIMAAFYWPSKSANPYCFASAERTDPR